jgi:hypothetical protein
VFSFFVSFALFSQEPPLCHGKNVEKEAFTSVLANDEHTILSIDKNKENLSLSVEVFYYSIYSKDSIVKTNTWISQKQFRQDTICLSYKTAANKQNEWIYCFKQHKNRMDTMLIFNHPCPLVLQKDFFINGDQFTVFKYYYDQINSSDEETAYYFCADYGLLIVDNDTYYGLWHTLAYDDCSKLLVEKILKDNSEFYKDVTAEVPPEPKGYRKVN